MKINHNTIQKNHKKEMCYHSFCSQLKFKRIKGEITNKIIIWIYTKRKEIPMVCFFKEMFGNYKAITGVVRDIDGGCYEKFMFRVLSQYKIIQDYEHFRIVFNMEDPVIKYYGKIPVFLGFFHPLSKKLVQKNLCVYEKMELFNLYGECPTDKYKRNAKATLDINTGTILQFSIDNDWLLNRM